MCQACVAVLLLGTVVSERLKNVTIDAKLCTLVTYIIAIARPHIHATRRNSFAGSTTANIHAAVDDRFPQVLYVQRADIARFQICGLLRDWEERQRNNPQRFIGCK